MVGVNSFNVGDGAAQVFDNRRTINTYAQIIAQEQQRSQKASLAAQEMLATFDPNKAGVRAADMKEYNQKYEEYRNLYIQNKKLYVNPASNIEAYNRAEKLKAEMKQIAAESKQMNGLSGEVAGAYLKDAERFDDESILKMKSYENMSVSEIKKANGGRLPDAYDMVHKVKEVDPVKFSKEFHSVLDAMGDGVVTFDVKPDGNGKQDVTPTKSYTFDGVSKAYDYLQSMNSTLRKNYKALFSQASPEGIAQLQSAVSQRVGKDFVIDSPEKFAVADLYMNFGTVRGDTKREDDPIWKKNEEERKDQRNFEQQKKLLGISKQNQIDVKRTPGVNQSAADEAQLLNDSRKIINNPTSPESQQALSKLNLFFSIEQLGKTEYKNATFKEYVDRLNNHAGTSGYQVDISTPEKLRKVRDKGVLVLKAKDEKGEDMVYMIDYSDPNAAVKLSNIYKMINKEKEKVGVMQGIAK